MGGNNRLDHCCCCAVGTCIAHWGMGCSSIICHLENDVTYVVVTMITTIMNSSNRMAVGGKVNSGTQWYIPCLCCGCELGPETGGARCPGSGYTRLWARTAQPNQPSPASPAQPAQHQHLDINIPALRRGDTSSSHCSHQPCAAPLQPSAQQSNV